MNDFVVGPPHKSGGALGIYVNESEILSAVDISNTIPKGRKRQVDLGVTMKLEIGRSFQPEFTVSGFLGKNNTADGKRTIGSAFVVRNLFSKLGIFGEFVEDPSTGLFSIPQEMIDQLPGKKFLRLSFAAYTKKDGKLGYNDWNTIGVEAVGDTEASLKQAFLTEYGKSGYPHEYRPDLVTAHAEAALSFPGGGVQTVDAVSEDL